MGACVQSAAPWVEIEARGVTMTTQPKIKVLFDFIIVVLAMAVAVAFYSYQMLKRGSPVFEMASAIQALALALSAMRSARDGAPSLSPPALMYWCAILPRDRQFSEFSYFTQRSRTSVTHRLAASLN